MFVKYLVRIKKLLILHSLFNNINFLTMISLMHLKKGFLIDPYTGTITETIIDSTKGLDDYYSQLGCRSFDIANIDPNNDVYIDDEGMFNNTMFFSIEGYYQPLAGKGIVMGFEAETGESISTSLTLDEVKAKVKFHTIGEVMEMVG